MNITASGRSASIIAAALWVCLAGPLHAAEDADGGAAVSTTENAAGPPVALGKFAHGISTDITCPKGGEVILSNRFDNDLRGSRARNSVSLPQSDLIKYLITIENHCDSFDESESTDFRLFYDVLEDPEEKEFDLRRIVATGRYGMPDAALKEQGDFALDGYPQNCLTGKVG